MFVKRNKTNYYYHHEMLCFMLLSHGSFISSVLFDWFFCIRQQSKKNFKKNRMNYITRFSIPLLLFNYMNYSEITFWWWWNNTNRRNYVLCYISSIDISFNEFYSTKMRDNKLIIIIHTSIFTEEKSYCWQWAN